MKYVTLKIPNAKAPVLFEDVLAHILFEDLHPISAGFWVVDDTGKVSTFGESISLKLHPYTDDALLIQKCLHFR